MLSQKTENSKKSPIILWAAPRCASTVFEQAFSQRPDTKTISEPFLDVYYFSKWRCSNRFGDCDELQDYGIDSVLAEIKSQTSPLSFIKEMAYQAGPYIDKAFLNSVLNSFIVRHPREAIASWYSVNEFPTEDEFGFTKMQQTWKIVTQELKHRPIVIEAKRFRHQPERVIKDYCQLIGIDFHPEMLSWEEGSRIKENGQAHEIESRAKWYKTLNNSTGILPPTEEIAIEIRSQDVQMVERALKIYEEISGFAI